MAGSIPATGRREGFRFRLAALDRPADCHVTMRGAIHQRNGAIRLFVPNQRVKSLSILGGSQGEFSCLGYCFGCGTCKITRFDYETYPWCLGSDYAAGWNWGVTAGRSALLFQRLRDRLRPPRRPLVVASPALRLPASRV